MKEKVVLNIIDKPPITQHTYYSMPLCIILTNKSLYPWYYEHFIQIFSADRDAKDTMDPLLKFGVFYCDNEWPFTEVINQTDLSVADLNSIDDLEKYLIDQIDSGSYIKAYLDGYYIKEKAAYLKYNAPAYSLIYGYDLQNKLLFALSFGLDFTFRKIKIHFDEFKAAFASSMNEFNDNKNFLTVPVIRLLQLKQINDYSFSLTKFKKGLYDYVHSKGEGYKISLAYDKLKQIRCFGMNANKDFVNYLYSVLDDKSMVRYHDFHIFWEHKKILHERFNYIASQYKSTAKFSELINQYSLIVERSNLIRNKYIKTVLTNNPKWNIYFTIQNKKVLNELIIKTGDIIEEEVSLLHEMLSMLDDSSNSVCGSDEFLVGTTPTI